MGREPSGKSLLRWFMSLKPVAWEGTRVCLAPAWLEGSHYRPATLSLGVNYDRICELKQMTDDRRQESLAVGNEEEVIKTGATALSHPLFPMGGGSLFSRTSLCKTGVLSRLINNKLKIQRTGLSMVSIMCKGCAEAIFMLEMGKERLTWDWERERWKTN